MPSDSFEENTGFQLPGLGSAEKDTPGTFRKGTPFNKISGPSPEPEVSRELVDLKDQQAAVQHAGAKADLMKVLSKHANMEKEGATQQFIDQMNQAVDNTTSEEDKQQQFIDGLSGSTLGKRNAQLGKDYARIDGEMYGAGNVPDDLPNAGFLSDKPLPKEGRMPTPETPGRGKPQEEGSLIDNLISGVKKYGPSIISTIGGPGLGIGKAIRDRIKGE